ncbi:MAG TPA: hypothetical protein VGN51_02285 [Acidimicrobiia bacterium]
MKVRVKVLVCAVVLLVTGPVWAQRARAGDARSRVEGAGERSAPRVVAVEVAAAKDPSPPRFRRNFHAAGRYLVKDLGVDVPFTWEGRDGDSQMIAGNEHSEIWFTNVISGGVLYTLTYNWPDIARRPCSKVGPFSLETLNTFLASSRYVGPEILEGRKPRHVQHFRAGVVWDAPPDLIPPSLVTPVGGTPDTAEGGVPLRFPLMLGDFYVDQKDPTKFWQVLHFGLHNLYDPQLDEWMVMDTFSRRAGTVHLPEECITGTITPAPGG